jgi:hypothetical protein
VAVLGDELDDRLDGLLGVAEFAQARGIVWLTICIEPPPTVFLNFTREKSGSMPVVSQSIMKPMVPVGASTEACALRQPCFSPSLLPRSHDLAARRSTSPSRLVTERTASVAAACLRMTRWWASALRA